MKKRHPFRSVLEWLGLVRTQEEQKLRFARADKAVQEGWQAVEESKQRRARLAYEAKSHRVRR